MSSASAHDSRDARDAHDTHGTPSPTPTILVIDDDPTIRQVTELTLRTERCACVTAANIEDGWRLIQRGGIGLVISDLNLNAMSLIARMRANPATSTIPIIISTGSPEDEKRRAALAAGASSYLIKPYPSEDLLKQVRRCLAQAEA